MNQENNIIHFVLGGEGFIGRTLVKNLVDSSSKVVVADIDIWDRGFTQNSDSISHLDLSQPNWAEKFAVVVPNDQQVRIWHLAANSDISRAAHDYSLDFKITLGSTIDIIDLATLLGKKCISIEFTSSSAVYGNRVGNRKFHENDKLDPISNYGVMKEASEKVLQIFGSRHDVPVHIYRLANIVGGGMTHGVIHDLVNKLKTEDKFLDILGNGTQLKTYLHVEDLVQIMMGISKNPLGLTLNVGPEDSGIRVAEIAKLILKLTGSNAELRFEEKIYGWLGDVVDSVMDVTKLNSLTEGQLRSSHLAVEDAIRSKVEEVF
jgi:UDP-glucose 4-epimerase